MARLCATATGCSRRRRRSVHCSCPDWASMCKHVAAPCTASARGSTRRRSCCSRCAASRVDELHAAALADCPRRRPRSSRVLATEGLAALFGIELADSSARTTMQPPGPRARGRRLARRHRPHPPRAPRAPRSASASRNPRSPKAPASRARRSRPDPGRPSKRSRAAKTCSRAAEIAAPLESSELPLGRRSTTVRIPVWLRSSAGLTQR